MMGCGVKFPHKTLVFNKSAQISSCSCSVLSFVDFVFSYLCMKKMKVQLGSDSRYFIV